MRGTVLMTDIEGSVALWDHEPEAMALATSTHNVVIEQIVTAHDGRFVSSRGEGDSTFSVFTDAARAIAAAAVLHDRLLAVNWPTRDRVRVRIALNTGTAGDQDEELVGAVPNKCARLRALIGGDQIILAESSVESANRVVPEGWVLTSIGRKVLRGLSRPEHAFLLRPIQNPGPVSIAGISSDLSWAPLRTLFVGRTAEAADFVGALDNAAESGEGRTVLVSGEPGVGKTRFLADLARRADAQGALVLYGRCDESALIPFQPFVQALGHVVTVDPYALSAGELSADLAVLFPQIATRIAARTPPGLDPETRRFRMFDAVERAVSFLGGARPLVLITDDLQWADQSTLMLLHHLSRAVRLRRVLLVVAYRDTELAGSQLDAALAALRRDASPLELPLGGLSPTDIGRLLELQAGHEIGEPGLILADRLHHETSGNALFVREVIRDLIESGRLVQVDGVWTVTEPIEEVGIPASLASVVRGRTGRLSPDAQALLSAASIVGSEFDLAVVADVAGLHEDAALAALDETLRSRLVVEQRATRRLFFAHAVVRRTIVELLSEARRERLHLTVGRVLEARAEHGYEVPVDELARHFGAAGERGRDGAVRYERMAGERALGALAFDLAADHFRRALAAVGHHQSVQRAELLLAMAEAQNRFGDIEQAKSALLEAAGLARHLRRDDLATRAALAFGGVIPTGSPLDLPTVSLLRDTLTMLPVAPSVERALVSGRLAQAAYWTIPRAERGRMGAAAVAMARELGDRPTLAAVLINHYWALDGPDELDERLAMGTEVERLGRALDDLELVVQGAKCRLHALLGLGDGSADEVAAELRTLADAIRQPEYLRLSLSYEAVCAGNAGRFDEAEQLALQARSILQQRGHRVHASIAHAMQVLPWRWLQGRFAERLDYYRQLVAFEPLRPTWRATVAWLEAETAGNELATEHLADLALDRYLAEERTLDWWPVTVGASQTSIALGRQDAAALLLEALLPYSGRNAFVGQVAFFGAVDLHLGDLATFLQHHDDAVAHHEAALERHRQMDATAYVALSEIALSEALRTRARPEDQARAASLAATGRRIAVQLGLQGVMTRADRMALTPFGSDRGVGE